MIVLLLFDILEIIFSTFKILAIVFVIVYVVQLICVFMHKSILEEITRCVLWWLTFSFHLPAVAAESGLIRKKRYAWGLVMISPAAVMTYWLLLMIFCVCTYDSSIAYENLKFTSRNDIAAITEIEDFPEFEYVDNTSRGLGNVRVTENRFTNSEEAEQLRDILDKKVESEDNIFWRKSSITDKKEIEFYGCNEVYVCERGWDSIYVKPPKGVEECKCHVSITIGTKGFMVEDEFCTSKEAEDYATPDSLYVITGVKFPDFRFVNCSYVEYYDGDESEVWLDLGKKPGRTMMESIRKSEDWNELKDGTFECMTKKTPIRITVDPQSQYVKVINGPL